MSPARTRRRRRTPYFAVLLSLLALLSPDLTLAPLQAGEPLAGLGPIDAAVLPSELLPQQSARPAGAEITVRREVTVRRELADAPRYQAALDAARAAASATGTTFAVVRDGELLWTGSSGRDRDGRPELTPATPLVIGSVTKTYVAATVLQLAEEGMLGLDDSAREYLPWLVNLGAEITIGQLLDHTSGLADLFNETTRVGLKDDPGRAWTAAEVLGTLHAPWYQPGEGWAYANTNYFLLGLIVEGVTGSTLAAELDRRFLVPLGLESTSVLDGAAGTALEPAWTSIFWGSGAMSASAADLARWGDALYGDSVLQAATRDAMLRLNDHDYGYGVQKVDIPGAPTGHGHTGLLYTYTTLLYHLPSEGVTIALLVNRSQVDLARMLIAEPPGDGPSLLELARGG